MVEAMLIGTIVFYPHADLWMAYIDFKRRQDVLRVGQLHWRVTKALNDEIYSTTAVAMVGTAALARHQGS